jgi:hypothetical protein
MRPFLLLLAPVFGMFLGCSDGARERGSSEPALTGPASLHSASGSEGPRLTLFSSRGGAWRSFDPVEIREIINSDRKMDFRWAAVPGPSGSAVAGYSYKLGDAPWTPYSLETTAWEGFAPDLSPGPWSGFSLRAIDEDENVRELTPSFLVFPGPRSYPEALRNVLVVLDTDLDALLQAGIWPEDYEDIEQSMIDYFFADADYQVHTTRGFSSPSAESLSHAASVFWFHSADVFNNDASVLLEWNSSGSGWHLLSSYVRSGGNLFLCGIQPLNALRWIDGFELDQPQFVLEPVSFEDTLTDPELFPHWVAADLRTAVVESTVPLGQSSPLVAAAESRISAYPDLEFDPLTLPGLDGFPYYDAGILPRAGAEVAYTDSKTKRSLGIRRLSDGGSNGSVMYLGIHPWFVTKSPFRALIQTVIEDFESAGRPSGELPAPDHP